VLPDADEGPLPKIVYAILLSALNKHATEIAVHRVAGQSRVDFLIDGVEHEEMRPPERLHEPIVRRLAVMGSLPTYAKGQSAEGRITLRIGSTREIEFALRVAGHGPELAAFLRVLKDSARSIASA
jgi:type II secretory ATPase GspE/PulE/Tfp pilus assembly ATPase PilB-like protein